MNRQLYIVLTQSGSILSIILRLITGARYNHASLTLDGSLQTMYSFGRRHPYNPFWGGFVLESPRFGTFKRFSNTDALVLSVSISGEQYMEIQSYLNELYAQRTEYKFNVLGLLLASIHIHFTRDKRFYCSEFVSDTLINFGVAEDGDFKKIVRPIDFTHLQNVRPVYCGQLREISRMADKAS